MTHAKKKEEINIIWIVDIACNPFPGHHGIAIYLKVTTKAKLQDVLFNWEIGQHLIV